MNTPRALVAVARTLVLPLEAAGKASPAAAAVSAIQGCSDSQTRAGVGASDTVKFGPSDRTCDVAADPYVDSGSDSREEKYFVCVIDSAGCAVRLDSPNPPDFFARGWVDSNAGVGESQFRERAHGAASGSAFYDSSVDTVSFALSAFSSSSTPSIDAYVELTLFGTCLRQGSGSETFAYTVPVDSQPRRPPHRLRRSGHPGRHTRQQRGQQQRSHQPVALDRGRLAAGADAGLALVGDMGADAVRHRCGRHGAPVAALLHVMARSAPATRSGLCSGGRR